MHRPSAQSYRHSIDITTFKEELVWNALFYFVMKQYCNYVIICIKEAIAQTPLLNY